jgi:hypothetical protein
MKHIKTFEQFVNESSIPFLSLSKKEVEELEKEGKVTKTFAGTGLSHSVDKATVNRYQNAKKIEYKDWKSGDKVVADVDVEYDKGAGSIHVTVLKESVRHFTKYFWTIDKDFKIEVNKITDDLAEDASMDNCDRDPNIVVYGSESNERHAHMRAEDIVKHYKKHGLPKNLKSKNTDEAGYESVAPLSEGKNKFRYDYEGWQRVYHAYNQTTHKTIDKDPMAFIDWLAKNTQPPQV